MPGSAATIESMAENENVTGRPAADDNGAETASGPTVPPEAREPVLKTRWRDRAWTFRAMIGVALASLLVGGLAGGAVMAAADDGDDDRFRHHRMGPWGPEVDGPRGWRPHGPRGFEDRGPRWRWDDGSEDDSPQQPTPSPSPEGSTS